MLARGELSRIGALGPRAASTVRAGRRAAEERGLKGWNRRVSISRRHCSWTLVRTDRCVGFAGGDLNDVRKRRGAHWSLRRRVSHEARLGRRAARPGRIQRPGTGRRGVGPYSQTGDSRRQRFCTFAAARRRRRRRIPTMAGFRADLARVYPRRRFGACKSGRLPRSAIDETNFFRSCDPQLHYHRALHRRGLRFTPPTNYANVETTSPRDGRLTCVSAIHMWPLQSRKQLGPSGGYEPGRRNRVSAPGCRWYFSSKYDTDRAGGFDLFRYLVRETRCVLGLVPPRAGALRASTRLTPGRRGGKFVP